MTAGLILTGYAVFADNLALIAFALMLITFVFAVWIWFGTYYIIEENCLYLKCGPIREKIAYDTIKSVKKSRNPLSSLALSIDRIEIRYGKRGLTLISPKDKEEFIEELRKKCPNVYIEL